MIRRLLARLRPAWIEDRPDPDWDAFYTATRR